MSGFLLPEPPKQTTDNFWHQPNRLFVLIDGKFAKITQTTFDQLIDSKRSLSKLQFSTLRYQPFDEFPFDEFGMPICKYVGKMWKMQAKNTGNWVLFWYDKYNEKEKHFIVSTDTLDRKRIINDSENVIYQRKILIVKNILGSFVRDIYSDFCITMDEENGR